MTREFKSFAELAAALAFEEAGMQAALIDIGNHLEKKARQKIGEYQPGWPQLAEATQADRARQGYTENDPLLRSGKLRDSISSEVEDMVLVVGSTDVNMVYQELGTEKIPPRPVFATLVEENRKFIIDTVVKYTVRSFARTGNWRPPTVVHQKLDGGRDD